MAVSCNTSKIPLQAESQVSDFPEIIIGTEGLSKKILQKGISWQTPFPGDEVEVHYSVKLKDGDYFDSSHDGGIPFRFILNQGKVIKGVEDGISTMRKGERAVLTIPPELGYGEMGSPPLIPPRSTLIFNVELIRWYPIRDISGDGGILKKIIREGEGWGTPNDEDEVLVKYVAKNENGTVVSKSDEGLEFSLTNGHLCPAMSKAVKTMRKEEEVELSVKFSYGHRHCENGTSTVDGNIPSSLNLIIHLKLISWRKVIDITGEKKILKKIMKTGEGYDHPNEGSLAKVIYIGKLENGTIFEKKGSDEEPFEYICAEEQINKDLDKSIMTMKKGEEALVKIRPAVDSSHGYKEAGHIHSSDSLLYEIKLIDFTKEKPFWKMEIQERLEACARNKHDGNVLFKDGRFQLASKKYEKECDLSSNFGHLEKYLNRLILFHYGVCINDFILMLNLEIYINLFNHLQASNFIEYNHTFNDEEKIQANSLRLSCYLNNAACKLKLGEYVDASRLCTKVLQLEPSNVKALFRRSQAYMKISDLEKAEEDIKNALAIYPNNKDVKMKYMELKEKQRQYVQHEARFFSHIISKIS